MQLTESQQVSLKAAIEDGLPLTARPYLTLAKALGTEEEAVLTTVEHWLSSGLIKRLGIVVQHRKLGYVANAMVVWDIPDAEVDNTAKMIAAEPFVTLCYKRPRRMPEWPYNLFSMIHGKSRARVMAQLETLVDQHQLQAIPRNVLFSTQQFKQRGAHYTSPHQLSQGAHRSTWISPIETL